METATCITFISVLPCLWELELQGLHNWEVLCEWPRVSASSSSASAAVSMHYIVTKILTYSVKLFRLIVWTLTAYPFINTVSLEIALISITQDSFGQKCKNKSGYKKEIWLQAWCSSNCDGSQAWRLCKERPSSFLHSRGEIIINDHHHT